jgi:hypothetical protein
MVTAKANGKKQKMTPSVTIMDWRGHQLEAIVITKANPKTKARKRPGDFITVRLRKALGGNLSSCIIRLPFAAA